MTSTSEKVVSNQRLHLIKDISIPGDWVEDGKVSCSTCGNPAKYAWMEDISDTLWPIAPVCDVWECITEV